MTLKPHCRDHFGHVHAGEGNEDRRKSAFQENAEDALRGQSRFVFKCTIHEDDAKGGLGVMATPVIPVFGGHQSFEFRV